ncbi:MAG: NRDE family protein [Desulfobacteraceae bacterium]|nr:NRDE family protein [Desulfobacteraceae bacterium]
MCLILFGYKISKEFPLILGANRDEFYRRPTDAMHFWEDPPGILAGKDLEQGGTWFGIGKNGTFAALTNYRNPAALKPKAPSRGEIILDFLNSNASPERFIRDFAPKANSYNGFNLILGNPDRLFWFTNVTCKIEEIGPGIHGLSNRFLNTPWPKVESGKKALEKIIQGPITPDQLFSILKDSTVPGDPSLPDTGVGLEWERILSPLFIESPTYGTRSSIAMLVDQKYNINITERTYSAGNRLEQRDRRFLIPG